MDLTQVREGTVAQGNSPGKQRSYNELAEYFDAHWHIPIDQSLERMRQLDKALQSPSRRVPAIVVTGTNGKSLTVHFATKLLTQEGLRVGSFTAPHILLYKERFALGSETIPSRQFADLANEVINTAEHAGLACATSELLTAMAFHYFAQSGVDVALLEATTTFGAGDPIMIANTSIGIITRVTTTEDGSHDEQLIPLAKRLISIVRPHMHILSGDQHKAILQILQEGTKAGNGIWEMPLRKLAPLSYPGEQLHGRCASLAERAAQLFLEHYVAHGVISLENSLLVRPAGQRGRPRLEVKRQQELHPRKTITQFWKETTADLPGKFQLLEKDKPTILLDTASNVDAIKQVLLGIRLLHYQRPHKGLALIIGAADRSLHNEEFLHAIRYFFKKTPGNMFVVPLENPLAGIREDVSWDVDAVTNDIKSMKVKTRSCSTLEEAFELAKKSVDERNGLIVICGSTSIIASYWKMKGIKKL